MAAILKQSDELVFHNEVLFKINFSNGKRLNFKVYANAKIHCARALASGVSFFAFALLFLFPTSFPVSLFFPFPENEVVKESRGYTVNC